MINRLRVLRFDVSNFENSILGWASSTRRRVIHTGFAYRDSIKETFLFVRSQIGLHGLINRVQLTDFILIT